MSSVKQLELIAKKACEILGIELWGIEFSVHGGNVLRVFIERPGQYTVFIDNNGRHSEGITIDDCERLSKQLSALLDVEDIIEQRYILEVSSPGVRRRLFKLEQYKHYIGKVVQVSMLRPVNNFKRINSGILTDVTDSNISIEVDNDVFRIAVSNIDRIFVDMTYDIDKMKGKKVGSKKLKGKH